jgi:hypothetical protein
VSFRIAVYKNPAGGAPDKRNGRREILVTCYDRMIDSVVQSPQVVMRCPGTGLVTVHFRDDVIDENDVIGSGNTGEQSGDDERSSH